MRSRNFQVGSVNGALRASLRPSGSGLRRGRFLCVDEANFLEGRQMFIAHHEMGGSVTDGEEELT